MTPRAILPFAQGVRNCKVEGRAISAKPSENDASWKCVKLARRVRGYRRFKWETSS
jgi:hypothetical protein